MTNRLSIGRCGASVAAAFIVAASTAHAQSGAQLLYEWSGRVDHEVQITPGRRGYDVRGINGQENPGRFRSVNGAPRGNGQLSVQRVSGRGDVDVINGGTVRIRDPQGGADVYRIRVYMQSAGGGYGRDDRRDRDRGRDDRGRGDRGNGNYGRRPF